MEMMKIFDVAIRVIDLTKLLFPVIKVQLGKNNDVKEFIKIRKAGLSPQETRIFYLFRSLKTTYISKQTLNELKLSEHEEIFVSSVYRDTLWALKRRGVLDFEISETSAFIVISPELKDYVLRP